jgi:hypothetical protein
MVCLRAFSILLGCIISGVQSRWVAFTPRNETTPILRKPGESVRRELLGYPSIHKPWDDDLDSHNASYIFPPSLDSIKNLKNFTILFVFANIVTLLTLMTLTIHYTCRWAATNPYKSFIYSDDEEDHPNVAHIA